MDEGKKNAPKALTVNDIRQRAHDWSLAGDVGLLAHLEQFSEDICKRTQETQRQLTELTDSYEEVFTKVGNVTNQFLALQNSQFVENRVYDEDTPTEEKAEVKKVPDAAEQEKILLSQYKEAVEAGLKLLDTHFEEVQLPPNSDSDEEDECSTGNSFIWKPKNPYAGKKFPLLIGSSEWWADDNVGLGDAEETLDTEKTISDSESDFESPQVNKKMESSSPSSIDNVVPAKPNFIDSSSEDLFGLNKEDEFENDVFSKGKNSILGEPQIFSPLFENQGEIKANVDVSVGKVQVPEEEVLVKEESNVKPKKVDNDFTRELMAKLASVTNKSEPVEKKTEPPSEKPKPKIKEEVLFDEPDDSSSDLFSGKINHSVKPPNLFFDAENDDQLFSGSKNLLFDSGKNFESDTVNKPEKISSNSKDADVKVTPKKDSPIFKRPLVNNLFEDIDDEDKLFGSKPVETNQKNESLPSAKNSSFNSKQLAEPSSFEKEATKGLFDDFDEDFESPLFNNKPNKCVKTSKDTINENKVDPLKANISDVRSSSSTKSLFGSNHITKHSSSVPFKEPEEKKISFIDTDDDDLFSTNFKEDSLFKEKKPNLSKLSAVEDDDVSLFAEKPKQDSISISSSRSSLFDDVSATKSKLASVFDKDKSSNLEDDLFNTSENSLFGETTEKSEDSLFSKSSNTSKLKSSLFDDFDDSDDLFGITKEKVPEKSVTEKPKIETNSLFEEPKTIKEEKILEKNVTGKPKSFLSDSLFGEEPESIKAGNISEKLKPFQSDNLFGEEPKTIKDERIQEKSTTEKSKHHQIDSLFGEDTEVKIPKSLVSERQKPFQSDNLFGEEPKTIKDERIQEKSTIEKPKHHQIDSLFGEETEVKIPKSLVSERQKPFQSDSLFGEESKTIKEEKIQEKSTTEKSKHLQIDSLFGEDAEVKTEVKISKSLVSERQKPFQSGSLFGEEPKTIKEEKIQEKSTIEKPKPRQIDSLFGEETENVKVKISESLMKEKLKKVDSSGLFGEGQKIVKEEKVKERTIKEEPKKVGSSSLFGDEPKTMVPKSIFDDIEDDDLFKTSSSPKPLKKTPEISVKKENKTKHDIFEDVFSQKPKKLFSDIDDADLFSGEKAEPKPKPPTSLSLKNTSEVKPKSIGKLNIPDNLKGKFEAMAKNISTGETRPKEEKKTEAVVKDSEEVVNQAQPEGNKSEASDSSYQPSSNLLKCPSKDRVKIQTKRRPQSRRARQEAIRNSVNFDEPTEPKPEIPSMSTDASKDHDPLFVSPVTSNPLSPSTDEEDYFNVPELDTNFEKEDQSLFKNNLFETAKDTKSEDLLFDNAPVLSPQKNTKAVQEDLFSVRTKPTPKKISIFDDEEDKDEDSLFRNEQPKAPEIAKAPNLFQNQTKKSLFEDEEEDELFGGTSIKTVTKSPSIPKEKINKNEEKSKEKGNPGFVDPLGLMSNDD